MGGLFGGGGGGSPPSPPKLRQVNTAVGGKLWTTAADVGNEWAQRMMANYGFAPPSPGMPAGWEAKYLGPGAKAMMGMAEQGIAAPGQNPQLSAAMSKAFGGGFIPDAGTSAGGTTWDLGSTPYQVSKELGQKPLQNLETGQQFAENLSSQWAPVATTLSGTDLYSVATQQAIANAQARQAALANATAGYNAALGAQSAAQASEMGSIGQLGGAAIKAFATPSTNAATASYQPSFFSGLFSGGTPGYGTGTGYGNMFGADYSTPPSDVAPGGGDTGGGMFGGS